VDKSLIIGFVVVVAGFLALDLGVLNRKAHVVKFKEALGWTAFWVSLALGFAVAVYLKLGRDQAMTFLTGYVVEQSLSVDNLFVFLLIFSSFRVPAEYQHRVLFWGIIGALGMRALCIGVGVVALSRFHWLSFVFGAILIYGGVKTAFKKDEDEDLNDGFLVRQVRRLVPISRDFEGTRFLTRQNGKMMGTPLLLALIVVEISDVIFAVDSIPAVLAISQDPFIVYTSNVFAILGLRSIYFALAHMMRLFHYLKYALALILVLVGLKIAGQRWYPVPVELTLAVIVGLLAVAIVASALHKPQAAE
jgi:tellurite resistance protein TerC